MHGFIVKIGEGYINDQNLPIDCIDRALMFKTQSDADLVAHSHKREGVCVQVLPHENNSVAAGSLSSGSYFEYHKEF